MQARARPGAAPGNADQDDRNRRERRQTVVVGGRTRTYRPPRTAPRWFCQPLRRLADGGPTCRCFPRAGPQEPPRSLDEGSSAAVAGCPEPRGTLGRSAIERVALTKLLA